MLFLMGSKLKQLNWCHSALVIATFEKGKHKIQQTNLPLLLKTLNRFWNVKLAWILVSGLIYSCNGSW